MSARGKWEMRENHESAGGRFLLGFMLAAILDRIRGAVRTRVRWRMTENRGRWRLRLEEWIPAKRGANSNQRRTG